MDRSSYIASLGGESCMWMLYEYIQLHLPNSSATPGVAVVILTTYRIILHLAYFNWWKLKNQLQTLSD